MAASSLIGNLSVLLTMDTAAFESGTSHASKLLKRTQRQFEQMGKKMKEVGQGLSTWVTLPIVGAGAAVLKMSGDFQDGMNRVGIATQASASEMAKMRELALDIGKSTTKSASESADAMDMLAKAGMNVTDILNGGARAAVALAEAAGSDLDPAAAAITDTMQQFKLATSDLPGIINNITGAVNESKFDFVDFQLGMAQAGGVAASAGVEFEDFTAALAATASQFASGSDAGTSMKTFLLSLTPSTKKAAKAFKEVGFNAYTSTGQLKPLAEIAEDLRVKFGNLSEQDLNATFKEMFGTDAIRTAIGLMKQGGAGIEEMQARIAKTDASAQAAMRMKGLNAEMEKLGGALETLAIKIGDSGLLSAVSGLITKFAEWVDWMSKANPATLKWMTIIAGVAAAVGPLLIVLGSMVSSVGVLLPTILKMSAALGLTGLAGSIKAAAGSTALFSHILLPLAALVGGVWLAYQNWDKIKPIVDNVANATDGYFGRVGDKLTEFAAKWEENSNKVETWAAQVDAAFAKPVPEGRVQSVQKQNDQTMVILNEMWANWNTGSKSLQAALAQADTALYDFAIATENAMLRVRKSIIDMVNKVSEMLTGGLTNAWASLKNKAKEVGDAFANLYDRVVGHSYIPDMVDGIAAHMLRLENVMVKPAKGATKATSEAFRQLAGDVGGLLNRLFPEAAAQNKYTAELALIDKALKAHILTVDEAAEARRRLALEGLSDPAILEGADQIDLVKEMSGVATLQDYADSIPELSEVAKQTTAEIAESFGNMASSAISSVRSMVDSFKSGDILGGIQGLLDVVMNVISALGSAGVIKGLPPSNYAGAKAMGGPVVPGKSYLVGENGPEFVTPRRRGFVHPNGSGSQQQRISIIPSPYFDVVVDGRVQRQVVPAMGQATMMGAVTGQQAMARKQRRSIP